MKLSELRFQGTFRDYQQKVLDDSKSYLEDGKIHIVAAPGSGKTTLGLEFICRLGKPALVLAPSITIRQQWGERFIDAYLPEGEQPEAYISYHISDPRAITCITYQALYSAMTGKDSEETDEEETEDEANLLRAGAHTASQSRLDVAAIIKQKHITTICLDEAHHLRTEWHRSITKLLDELEDKVTVIALTATPPYDSSPAEWKKYTDLCGPIDAEISIPQLVGQKTLCPHQDLVFFSYPTKEERVEIHALKQRASKAITDVMNSGILEKAFTYFQQNTDADNEDYLYQHIEEFRAFLYCVSKSGVEIPKLYHKLISERKKTAWFSRTMAQMGCQFVVDNTNLFGENISEEMLAFFRERHVTDRKRIDVTADKTIAALLASSMGKLGGIQAIVRKETENLGDDLRMVILTDYIKKNLVKLIGTEDPLVEMGTVPIFESLRREKIPGARLGVLSGTLTILPDTALTALNRLALIEGCSVSIKPIRETGFSRVEFSGGNKKKVRIVTKLFHQGEINIMVGTKSLLGEGWDSPCINSLILASFVGSFMLSNQMRGRAIRIDTMNPEKVSNVWHLITPETDEGIKAAFARLMSGDAVYENSMTLGEDYETVARRFDCFMAPSLKEDVIQSGIGRLGIDRFMGRSEIEEANRRMLALSADRIGARDRWDRSIANCANEEMEICQKNEFRKEAIPTKHGFFNLASYLLLMTAATVLQISAYKSILSIGGTGGGLLSILVLVLVYVLLLRGIHYAIRLLSPTRMVEAIAKAILSAFQQNGTIRSENSRVEVGGDSDGLHIYSTLKGGTLREKQLFADAMRELLSPMNNPRYVILKRAYRIPQYYYSMACPSLLGNNKQNAELFQKELARQLGDMSVIYTRNEAGHSIYKKCVKRSFVNFEVNSVGSVVRKEVY
ncbi:MAG: DEAD/DEAH box helicase family protein [Oscillospiraceae bacterium]|nr:DEAD/DEAH box helicase family protein [Oscillospiraceae bacterium]